MKFFYLCFFFCLLATVSCSTSKDDCEPGPIKYPNQQGVVDGTAYKNSLLECRLPKVQTFEFNSYERTELMASQGTIFFIMPNIFFEMDGSPIDGTITFSVLEMYDPGEIIACQLSTNGLNNAQHIEPLLSESIFFISASHKGNPVKIEGEMQVFVPSENRGLELSIFTSPTCPQLECEVLWEKTRQSSVFDEPYTDASGRVYLGYQSFINDLGWFSIARYNDDPEARGIIYNKALAPYTLTNSKTFLKYDSNSTAIGMFSEYDEVNEVFSEKYHEIPNNTHGNVIFVSKPESQFNYEANQVITNDGKITVTRQLNAGSENDLIEYINNL